MDDQHTRGGTDAVVIEVDSLTKRYGRVTAVDDLTFSLRRGTITGFLGPNGAGKSTTLRLLLGLARPTAGTARLLGRRYLDLDAPARQVGAVLEADDFHPGRSGRDHLRVLAAAADIAAARVTTVLGAVELERAAEHKVATYSLGMRRRLGIAGALLGDPGVLILDEPSNGLDPAGLRWLHVTLRQFADRGGTVLLSSHALGEIAQTADQVIIFDQGRLVGSLRLEDLAGLGQTLEDAYLGLIAREAA